MKSIFYFSVILFCISFCELIYSLNYIDPGFTRFEYAYANAILQPYYSKNTTDCSSEKQFHCFHDILLDSDCGTDVFLHFDSVGQKYLDTPETFTEVTTSYNQCSIKKYNQIKNEQRYLWILAGMKDVRKRSLEIKITSLYPRCVTALKKLCNQYDELESLSMTKIGLIATSESVQNLTFNDVENMKYVAAKNPELEKFLCNRNTKLMSLDSPDSAHRWFTLEEYEGMKVLLEENQYFRWTFCSGVFAISSSSNLVCFPSKYRNCGDVLRNLPANDSFKSLRNCRKIARSEDFQHSAICN